jgi:hypothetical protein
VPPEKTVPEGEAVSKGRVGLAMHMSKEGLEVSSVVGKFPDPTPTENNNHSLGFFAHFKYDDRVRSTGLQSGEHEQGAIRAFVQQNKQERFLGFLANPKNRKKFTESLAHFRWFDRQFATPILWKVDPKLKLWERHVQGIDNIYRLLKSKGAGATCWAISEDRELDGRELDLRAALEHVNGRQIGTILSCVAGKLAYFESEDEALLLAR